MALTVNLFGNIRILLNREKIRLEWNGGTLREMIINIAIRYDTAVLDELFDETGEMDRAYVLFVNGEMVDDLSSRIEDGDEVVINSMLAGG